MLNRLMLGKAYIRNDSDDPGDYWAEGQPCFIETEATDTDEIRIGVTCEQGTSDDVTLYLSRSEAARLATFLSAAVVTEVIVGQPA